MKMLNLEEMDEMPTMLHFDESELPEVKKWKVGGKYTLLIDVEQTGMRKDPMDKGETEADFKVISVNEYKKPQGGNYDPEVISKAVAQKR